MAIVDDGTDPEDVLGNNDLAQPGDPKVKEVLVELNPSEIEGLTRKTTKRRQKGVKKPKKENVDCRVMLQRLDN